MLFAVKNRLAPTLLLLVTLAAGSLAVRSALSLHGDLNRSAALPLWVAAALACVLASDAILHGLLWLGLGHRYQARFQALAEYFRPQGPLQIAGGGLLAGLGEELFFRGVVLAGLWRVAGWHPVAALLAATALFALGHWLPDRKLAPFAVWAAVQSLWLGALYLVTGSLVACIITHALHDVLGFKLFALYRRTGWAGFGPLPRLFPRKQV
jgi:membrane protease YdiL (CAAX protease family)